LRATIGSAVLLAALVAPAHASPVELYGFGARKMGRAGEGVALADGTESVLSNPAALAGIPRAELSAGFLVSLASFTPVPDVWWDTNRDGRLTAEDPPLEVGPAYDPVQGVLVGATRPLGRKAAIGAALFVPRERIIRLATFEPSLPTYVLYANRAQRYELGLGAGWRPWGGFAIGGGVQLIPRASYSLDGTLDLTVTGASSADATASDVLGVALDVHAMQLDLKPGVAPNASLHWDAGQLVPALEGLQLGAAWRGEAGLPVDVDIDLQVNTAAEDVGDLGSVVLPLIFAVRLGVFDHYVPEQLTLGAAYTFADTLTISADVRRTAWDRLVPSVAQVVDADVRGAMVDLGEDPVEDGNVYALTLRPTLAPRVGLDLRLPASDVGKLGPVVAVARGGVGFEPTPFVSQGTETAMLDADRLLFAVGAGVEHADPFRSAGDHRVRWDAFFQYHLLSRGSLSRPDPGVPTAGYPVDGSDVPIGGHLLAAGLQGSFEY
jgi:hypothetical protein